MMLPGFSQEDKHNSLQKQASESEFTVFLWNCIFFIPSKAVLLDKSNMLDSFRSKLTV